MICLWMVTGMKSLSKNKTLGYHAVEDELSDKRNLDGCLLVSKSYKNEGG